MKQKHLFGLFKTLFFAIMAILFGVVDAGAYGIAEATISDLADAGKTITGNEGGLTSDKGREASSELYVGDVDKRITKMRPMATPIDQISRHGKALSAESMEIRYYSVGSRAIKTTVTEAITETAKDRTTLKVADASMFDVSDTIRLIGIKGYKEDGTTAMPGVNLMVRVLAIDDDGYPVVHPINGKTVGATANSFPAIASGTVVVRMGRACAEIDAQTGVFSNVPTPEYQYCQNFMMQVEESTFNKMEKKEVDWKFSDLEEDAVYDMRLGMENSFLFGVKGKTVDPKAKKTIYSTGGIWWMAGKDIEVGTTSANGTVINEKELVDIAKDLFTGTGVGNKRKLAFVGSDMLAAFAKIESDKFKVKESFERWGLKFKSFDTDFGEVMMIHHELFDMNDMAGSGLVVDPVYLTKKTFKSWERSMLDLKKSGQRNTNAVVLQEASCLYLRYPKAHARMTLAK